MKRKIITVILFSVIISFLFAEDNYSKIYKTVVIDKKECESTIIETELFGKFEGKSIWGLSRLESGVGFTELYYKVGDDNLCLGIRADVADQSVVYINTQKDCGTKCKIYLDRPEEKQILYRWSPLTEIITDNTKEKIEIITNKRKHILFVKKDIKEIEINSENLSSKIKKIKGLEKLPKLENIKFIGFDL